MLIKRWESPRRQGRNSKGKLASARAKQLKKRDRLIVKRLKNEN